VREEQVGKISIKEREVEKKQITTVVASISTIKEEKRTLNNQDKRGK